MFQQMAKLSTKTALCEQQKTWLDSVVNTNKQQFTCSRMEQAEFGEDRSSISDPLDPDDATLIWSARTFFAPSFTVRKLKIDSHQFGSKSTVRRVRVTPAIQYWIKQM